MNILSKLIPIGNCPSFGDGLIDTVNARDLHSALEVKNHFREWIKDRLGDCGFIEGEDFVSFAEKSAKPGRPPVAYFLTLDAAKHFAMLERNAQGFKVRQYFVEFEKQAKKTLPAKTYKEMAANALTEAVRVITHLNALCEEQEEKITVLSPKAEVFDAHCGRTMSLREFCRTLEGVNLNQVKKDLVFWKYLFRSAFGIRVYSQYRDTHFVEKVNQFRQGDKEIYVLPEGKKLLTKLYKEGKLTMKVGYAA